MFLYVTDWDTRKVISQPFPATSSILYLGQPRMLGKDVVMFNAAMGACEKASAWQNALCLFNESPSPDVISYNCLMSTLFAERLAGMFPRRLIELMMVESCFRLQAFSGTRWLPDFRVSSWHHLWPTCWPSPCPWHLVGNLGQGWLKVLWPKPPDGSGPYVSSRRWRRTLATRPGSACQSCVVWDHDLD